MDQFKSKMTMMIKGKQGIGKSRIARNIASFLSTIGCEVEIWEGSGEITDRYRPAASDADIKVAIKISNV